MSITIQPATGADAEVMSSILCASIRELCEPDHGGSADVVARWTANKTPEHLKQWLAAPQLHLFIAEFAGEPAGIGAVAEQGEVLLNYVAPEHRFRGVTNALLLKAERILRDLECGTGRLTSTVTAHPFYLNRGWLDAGEPVHQFGLQGRPMNKRLSHEPP